MSEGIIPLFAIFFVFGAPVAAWIISRVLAHQERMEMIRNGFVPPPDGRSMRNAARYGNYGQMPPPPPSGPIPPTMQPYTDNYYAQAQMRKGITVTLIGFAILIGLSFIGEHGQPGPWLLGGLIPMFVGIAQIINAVLNGATIPRMGSHSGQNQSASFGPRPVNGMGATPPPNQPPPAAGPYAWRPGSTPEIEKPAQPPDNR
jgi:hypothetical protein